MFKENLDRLIIAIFSSFINEVKSILADDISIKLDSKINKKYNSLVLSISSCLYKTIFDV